MPREKKILTRKKCKICGSKFMVERKHQRESRNQICKGCMNKLENEDKRLGENRK